LLEEGTIPELSYPGWSPERIAVKIALKFHSRFREAFPFEKTEVELPDGATVRDLLEFICKTESQRKTLFHEDNTRLRRDVLVTKNRMFVFYQKSMETVLQDRDEISIHYPACMG
jgi:molybdopterin converting factor small subunit